MAQFSFFIGHFADIVQQAGTFGQLYVEPEFACHDGAEIGHFTAVHEQVLPVGRAEPHFTHDTHQFFMQAMNAQFNYRTFADFHHLFFQLAAAVGYRRGLHTLVGGMCETDFSGYPDCRDDTLKALQVAVSLGMGQRFTFETPLMWLDKAQTWDLARTLGGDALVDIVLEQSHTCYHGVRGERHAWGYGCGTCPACALRKAGFERWTASKATLNNPG